MVRQFQLARVPAIIFRPGCISVLPALLVPHGKKVAIVTGKNSFLDSPAFTDLASSLADKNISLKLISIKGEPSPGDIDPAAESLREDPVDAVVGIGGGAVLDAGKAIAAMAGVRESVVRFLEGVGDLNHPGTRLPYIAVPTTSGTGSEATKNAVISRIGANGFKKSLRHDNFVPDIALVDPGLTLNCPRDITAASGMDCFTQLTEAFLSDKGSEYTDALALEGLKAVRDNLKKCCTGGSDIEARSGMSFAALTSGICLANAGLGTVHGFASSVGGLFRIPHGLVCGTLMAVANKVNVRKLRISNGKAALARYAVLGRLFLGDKGKTDEYYIDGFIDHLQSLTEELGLPGLGTYGITSADIHRICIITENKNNPVRLELEELEEILGSRI